MEQATNGLSIRYQAVINLDRGIRFHHVYSNVPVFEQVKRFLTRPQHQQHTATQYDRFTAIVDQLFDVCRLDSWHMVCVRFAPVPLPTAARPELEVLTSTDTIDFYMPPSELGY